MYRLIAALLLSGCIAGGTDGFRRPGPIYSNAVLEVPRLAGSWHQVAAFSRNPGCAMGGLEITPDATGLAVSGKLCLGGRIRDISGRLRLSGPGRFTPDSPGFAGAEDEWWILWADSGYRSLAIGTPSGDFGFVLDRGPVLPVDRKNAAQEIFDWNGYRLEHVHYAL
ncbi:MAG: lipocalin [Pseudorhodobacter sp.]